MTVRIVSHVDPVHVGKHTHVNEFPLLNHVPPLRHGFDAHGDKGDGVVTVRIVSHLDPVQPAGHVHMNEFPLL